MSATPTRPLALADLLDLKAVSDPRISPDGSRVAFVVETKDLAANEVRSRIWLVDAAGGVPRPLTAPGHRDNQPRWSPDGQTLAFVSDRSGARQIWLLSLLGGEPVQLTDQPGGASEPAWPPDGQTLAFLATGADDRGEPPALDEPDDRKRLVWVRQHRHKLDGRGFFGTQREHVWMIAVAGGSASQLTDGPYEDLSPAWSPDGREIAFVSDRSAERDSHYGGGAVHVVEVATGTVRRLTPENGRAAHPSWSPDGKWIAYAGSDRADDATAALTRLWVVDTASTSARCLTAELDRSVGQSPGSYLTASPPVWDPSGESIYYLIGTGPSTQLGRLSVAPTASQAGDPFTYLTAGRQAVQAFTMDHAARRAALLITNPTQPAEVWKWDAEETAGARPLTALNRELLGKVALATPEDLRITRPDGTVVEGWLLRPATSSKEPVPLLLSVHGGPHNYFGDTFSFDHQLYAAQGYAVLYGNPRGSGGYSEAFAEAVYSDWGGEDFQDLLALVDHALERGDPAIDPKRLAITGSSYGGFMTCWAITQTDRFAVAVSGACISNLVSFYGTSDIGGSWGAREFAGVPAERLDWYLARSPVHHAARVKTPLLLYHGESDLRCPIGQSEEMFTTLQRQGKTVEFLRVPTESHGVLNGSPAHRIEARRAILEWFERYLS